MSSCGKAHHRVCGDIAIEERIPGFFNTHKHAGLHEELQVCVNCGDVLKVPAANYEDTFHKQQLRNFLDSPLKAPIEFLVAEYKASEPVIVEAIPIPEPEPKPVQAPVVEKACTKCKEVLPIEAFAHNRSAKDGRSSGCLQCIKQSSKASRLKKIDHYRAMNRAWNHRHQDQLAARKRERKAEARGQHSLECREGAA